MTTRTSPVRAAVLAALAAAAPGLGPPGTAAQEPAAEALRIAPSVARAEVDYTYALAAYRDGDLDEAERLLRSAIAFDPEHGGAWHALGLVHLSRGETEEARAALRRSLAADRPPPAARGEVRARLESLGPAVGEPAVVPLPDAAGLAVIVQALPRWEARVGASYGDDSNPALQTPDGIALLPDGSILEGERSDAVAGLDLRVGVHPFYGGGWSLELGVEGSQSLHDELDLLDYRRVRGFAHLARGGDPAGYAVGPLGTTRVPLGDGPFGLLLQAAVSDDEIDGDAFAGAVEAGAALTFRETGRTATQLDLTWRDEDLDQPGRVLLDPQRRFSGERQETAAALWQWFWFSGRDGYVRLGGRAGERDAGGAFDSALVGAAAELSAPLSPRALLFLAGSWEREEFDSLESNPAFGTAFGDAPREDAALRASAAVSFGLTPRLWLTVRGTLHERESDFGSADELIDFDRDRTVAAVSLRWFVDGGRVER